MPDPKDPTPVKVKQVGGRFVVVDRDGRRVPGAKPVADAEAAQAEASRINDVWKTAKADRKAKGAPEVTESRFERVLALLADELLDEAGFGYAIGHGLGSPGVTRWASELHPRSRAGEFARSLHAAAPGEEFVTPSGHHVKVGTFRYTVHDSKGGKVKLKTAEEVARHVGLA